MSVQTVRTRSETRSTHEGDERQQDRPKLFFTRAKIDGNRGDLRSCRAGQSRSLRVEAAERGALAATARKEIARQRKSHSQIRSARKGQRTGSR